MLAAFVVYFFRNPPRTIPTQPGVVVSPADGQVFSIREVDHDDYLGGPAVVIDIFLSVFNVHLNRVPMECRVIGLTYRRGKFLNALRPEAARENESLEVRLETTAGPVRALRVRQIAGAIARRIVCWVRPGEHLPRGGQFGMIKLGSRTELTIPRETGLEIRVRQGQKVQAGTTVMAQYTGDDSASIRSALRSLLRVDLGTQAGRILQGEIQVQHMHHEKQRRRKIRHITFPALPTAFTLANGVCGLAAITVVTSHVPNHTQIDLAFYAALLIFLGMVFDVLDGHIARMTRQTSQFGKELDSLCDVITFGVAPVFIMFTYSEVFQRRLLWGIGVLYAVAAILRLARFNVHKDEHAPTKYFRGLPTPMAAGTIASFAIAAPSLMELTDVLMPESTQEWARQVNTATMVIVPILTGVLAWLMVSHIRYPHVASALARRRSFPQLVELMFAMVVAITLKEFALPVLFGYFVFAPPINQLRLRTMTRPGPGTEEPTVAGRGRRGRTPAPGEKWDSCL